MLLIPFNLFSWSVTSEKKVPKEVCLDLLKQTPKFTNIHVVVSLRLQSYSHIVPTIFPRPIWRTFPGLRLIFQSSKIHINPRSQLLTTIYISIYLTTRSLFPGLSSPEKYHNILGFSWFFRTCTNPVYTSCFEKLDEP